MITSYPVPQTELVFLSRIPYSQKRTDLKPDSITWEDVAALFHQYLSS